MKPKILLGLFLTIFIFSYSTDLIYADKDEEDLSDKHVLYLSSYSPSYETFFDQVDGIKSILEPYDVVLDIEFMDSKRLFTDENYNNFYTTLSYKLKNLPTYDAVIVADDNGTNFIMEYKDELFPDTPIIFLGVNNLANATTYSNDPYVTGVVEEVSIGDTIEMAYGLKPDAKRVVALVDNTVSGQFDLEIFHGEKERFSELEFAEIHLYEMTFEDFSYEVSLLSDDDIILYLAVFRDITGTTLTFDQGMELTINSVAQPMFYPYYPGLGNGFTGGKVVSHFEQGVTAGSILLRVLTGENIADIPVIEESPNKYVTDYNVLQKYGLDESNLPEGTLILNKEISFFEQYFAYILAIIFVVILESLIILLLLRNIRERTIAQIELLASKTSLQNMNEAMESTNEELHLTLEEVNAVNSQLTTSMKEIEKRDLEIHNLIYVDSLTGLNNRFAMSELINESIYDKKNVQKLAVIFLDVDNFKNINDTFGHDTGDLVIKQTGVRLSEFISEDISIGRFGGDEFLICIKNVFDHQMLIDIANKISNTFEDILNIEDKRFFLTVSIGISIYPDNCLSQEDLIKKADLALYKAKASGKNTFIFYEDEMDSNLKNKMLFQQSLREALKNKDFYLNFQPLVRSKTHEVFGYETLIRWYSPKLGQVSPYQLIMEAEEMGLIIEIGAWVFHEACKFAREINKHSTYNRMVTVNVSAVQLMHSDFLENVISSIDATGVDPQCIVLEMTETVLMKFIDTHHTLLNKLSSLGLTLAMDDFGTGYSSLSYFKNLSATLLKVDKSFIDGIATSDYDQYIVEAIINLAHRKGLIVIAEGIEEEAQYNTLKSMDCDIIQGYYFSKPLSHKDALTYVCPILNTIADDDLKV